MWKDQWQLMKLIQVVAWGDHGQATVPDRRKIQVAAILIRFFRRDDRSDCMDLDPRQLASRGDCVATRGSRDVAHVHGLLVDDNL